MFSSIGKLAAFSDKFLGQLESALGDPGNVGEDHVGKLFLESVCVSKLYPPCYDRCHSYFVHLCLRLHAMAC